MNSKFSPEALVLYMRQGDKKAFQQLYKQYYKTLLGVITKIVKDPFDAEDVLQDTFLKIWQRFHYFDAQQGSLFTWMISIARNTAISALRQRKGVNLPLSVEAEAMPLWPLTDTIEVKYLARQILKPHQWMVVELAYWRGYTYQEIADELDLPLGTVKSRIHQSLLQLRPLFQ